MAHSPGKIELALRTVIQEAVDDGKEDLLTVRYVRNKVVESLKLDDGFFLTDEWKDRSKAFIKKTAEKLIDAKEQQPTASIEVTPKATKKKAAPIKKAPKRAAQSEKSRPTKRRKKEETPSEDEDSEVELSELSEEDEGSSPVSDFDDSDISDAPRPRKSTSSKPTTKAKPAAKRQTKQKVKELDSEDELSGASASLNDLEESEAASTPPIKGTKKAPSKRKSKGAVVDSDEESEDKTAKRKASNSTKFKSKKAVVDSDEESEVRIPTKVSKSPEKTKSQALPKREPVKAESSGHTEDSKADAKGNDSDSSEMSVVLDEPPKSKKRGPQSTGTKKSKTTSSKAPPKELTPNEALIKTLQSQLVKCGVRKIWAFELKPYADDEKAKIRHLQNMLKSIGMTGRFSEQRAKEIKELRELQADLEAVKEGEKSWGLESGRRARGMRKSLKESSEEEEDDDEDDYEGNRGKKGAGRSASEGPSKAARAKQELAFLGDDDSDSD